MKNEDHYDFILLPAGKISKLRCYTREYDFITTRDEHIQIGITAIVATAMGMGAQAAGMVGSAGNKAEKAHWLEFELDGKKIQGWVWKMLWVLGIMSKLLLDILEAIATQLMQ